MDVIERPTPLALALVGALAQLQAALRALPDPAEDPHDELLVTVDPHAGMRATVALPTPADRQARPIGALLDVSVLAGGRFWFEKVLVRVPGTKYLEARWSYHGLVVDAADLGIKVEPAAADHVPSPHPHDAVLGGPAALVDLASAAAGAAGQAVARAAADVVLEATGPSKIQVIAAIRRALDVGLKEAKDLAEAAPCRLSTGLPLAAAQALRAELEALGARVSLR